MFASYLDFGVYCSNPSCCLQYADKILIKYMKANLRPSTLIKVLKSTNKNGHILGHFEIKSSALFLMFSALLSSVFRSSVREETQTVVCCLVLLCVAFYYSQVPPPILY